MTKQETDILEQLVDNNSLATVVETLAEICYAKAEHIRTSWQDEPLAKKWDKAGRRIITAANHPGVTWISLR